MNRIPYVILIVCISTAGCSDGDTCVQCPDGCVADADTADSGADGCPEDGGCGDGDVETGDVELVTVHVEDFQELMVALEEGRRVRVVLDLENCATTASENPEANASIEIDVWEYFNRNVVYNPREYVTFSSHSIIRTTDAHIRYFKIRIYEDAEVQVIDEIVDALTFATHESTEYSCSINTEAEPDHGASLTYEALMDSSATSPESLELLDSQQAILDALIEGRSLQAVYYYGRCPINGTSSLGPDAIGGMEVLMWEYFSGPDYIEFAENSLIKIPSFGINGFIYDWVFARIYDTGDVVLTAEYMHPTTFDAEMHEYFECSLHTEEDDSGGVAIWAY